MNLLHFVYLGWVINWKTKYEMSSFPEITQAKRYHFQVKPVGVMGEQLQFEVGPPKKQQKYSPVFCGYSNI